MTRYLALAWIAACILAASMIVVALVVSDLPSIDPAAQRQWRESYR